MGRSSQINGERYENDVKNRINSFDASIHKAIEPMFGITSDKIISLQAEKIPAKFADEYDDNKHDYLDINPNEYSKHHKTDILAFASFMEGKHLRNVNVGISCKTGSGLSFGRESPIDFVDNFRLNDEQSTVIFLFTGYYNPEKYREFLSVDIKNLRDPRRAYLNELNDPHLVESIKMKLIKHEDEYIERTIRCGCDDSLNMNWFLFNKSYGEYLVSFDELFQYAKSKPTIINNNGNIRIGAITVQRNGGSSSPTDLQGKYNPPKGFFISKGIKIS